MNSFDFTYMNLLQEVLVRGSKKETRAGEARSIFGKTLTFDLTKGIPALTTKKVYTKGVLHELLWFLNKDENKDGMNIRYLVENNVHIWDDDAYRWFKEVTGKALLRYDDVVFKLNELSEHGADFAGIEKVEFLERVLKNDVVRIYSRNDPDTCIIYRFGDLGPVYGTQWRNYGFSRFDQVENIVKLLVENPDDRRMVCFAYNPDVQDSVALPPCHTSFQVYTKELSDSDRFQLYRLKYGDDKIMSQKDMDDMEFPKRSISLSWNQRSVDVPLGLPFNILSYGILLYMLGNVANMIPDQLTAFLGDCHIYENQVPMVEEMLGRHGSTVYPQLKIKGTKTSIDDFKFEDFEFVNYYPEKKLEIPLSTGLQ